MLKLIIIENPSRSMIPDYVEAWFILSFSALASPEKGRSVILLISFHNFNEHRKI